MVSDFRPHESYRFFLQEAPDLLRDLEEGILELLQMPNLSKVWDLMRTAHSLKGGAACAGLPHIQEIAHHLETAFKTIAETDVQIDPTTEELLLQAFDCLKQPILEEMQSGNCDVQRAIVQAQAVWAELEQILQAKRLAHTVAPGEQDVTHLLFSEDVSQGLSRLSAALQEGHHADQLDAIKTQVQIFRGIGEITNLQGFVDIADAALTALQQNPQSTQVIGELTLNNFRAAHREVLAGDRQQGGSPSADLLQFLEPLPLTADPAAPAPPLFSTSPPAPRLSSVPATGLVPQRSPVANSTAPVVIAGRQDWERLALLNTLVGELVSLDNRLLVQNQQHEASLEVFQRCYSRIKQQVLLLYRYSHQSPTPTDGELGSSAPIKPFGLQATFLQTTLEDILEELSQLNETFKDLSLVGQQYQQILKQKQKTTQKVKTNLLQTQMLPVSELFQQFPRMVRDLSRQEGKPVHLTLHGDHTLIEKSVLEQLFDPLVHLVRNAFDHGIEETARRQALNKPPQGTLVLRAWQRGHHTYISVEDDGQGIHREAVLNKAIALGWLSPEKAAELTDAQVYQLLFEPDFSTATTVNHLSGRGIGLYAVQTQVNALKGTITIKSQPGKGTTFTLRLPLTSTVTKLIVFRIQRHLFALPVNALAAITIATETLLHNHQNQSFYYWKDQFVPILNLSSVAAYSYPLSSLGQEDLRKPAQRDGTPSEPVERFSSQVLLLLIARGTEVIALKIDEILREQDLVIKPFNQAALTPPPYLHGCTLLGDGQLVPVLDGAALVEQWGTRQMTPQPLLELGYVPPVSTAPPALHTILVIDDSLTIRNALSMTLRRSGYRVVTAKDGWEALGLLKQEPAAAIICDIEMPRMNGLEFLSRCRQQASSIPIIMLTYRSGQRYRRLAEQLGAAAYLTKPYLDQELLSTLERCLQQSHAP